MNFTQMHVRILLACMALGAILMSAGHAKADSNSFIEDLYAYGFYTDNPTIMVVAGLEVCEQLKTANGLEVANWVYYNTDPSVTRDDAANFVIAAVENLCPVMDHRNEGIA